MDKNGLGWWLSRDADSTAQKHAAEASWESWQMPHRQNIAVAFQLCQPFASLYEVGCQAGPNLRMAKALYPDLEIAGSEPCPYAAGVARERLQCTIDEIALPQMPSGVYDVVLSSYCLAYVSPDDITETLANMMDTATKAVVLMEPCAWGPIRAGLCRDDAIVEWRHAYHELIPQLDWRVAWAWPLIPAKQNANAVIVAVPR